MRSRVYRYLAGQAWAILEEDLPILQSLAMNPRLTAEELRAEFGVEDDEEAEQKEPVVALLGIYGPILPRGGAMSAEGIAARVRAATAREDVKAIVLDIDTPGGAVAGIQEAAQAIREARVVKPVVAVANTLMASAGYWLGSQASEIVATPSAELGSIGVIMVPLDFSKVAEREGIKATFIHAGKHKAERHPLKGLTKEAVVYMQQQVDALYGRMTEEIGEGLGVSSATVRGSSFGEGRTLFAADAVKVGMAHSVGTLEETIARVVAAPSSIELRPLRVAAVTVPALPVASSQQIDELMQAQATIQRQIEQPEAEVANPETIAQDSHVTRPGAAEENEMDETKLAALIAEHTAKAVADAVAPLEAKISGLEATSNKAVEIAQKSAEELAATNKANATALAKGKLDLLVDEGRISPADAAEALEDFPHLPADRWAARIKAFEARDPSFVDLSRPLVVKGANGEPVTVELISLPTANGQSLQYGSDAHDEAAVRAAHTNAKGELDYDAYRAALYARHGERAPVLQ